MQPRWLSGAIGPMPSAGNSSQNPGRDILNIRHGITGYTGSFPQLPQTFPQLPQLPQSFPHGENPCVACLFGGFPPRTAAPSFHNFHKIFHKRTISHRAHKAPSPLHFSPLYSHIHRYNPVISAHLWRQLDPGPSRQVEAVTGNPRKTPQRNAGSNRHLVLSFHNFHRLFHNDAEVETAPGKGFPPRRIPLPRKLPQAPPRNMPDITVRRLYNTIPPCPPASPSITTCKSDTHCHGRWAYAPRGEGM